ncbi:hypothetical protein BDD12DRAFT_897238 [Trichophaea hybrida]|nr:hypothetical protein BDD12DRAFT_897238 [Trichophaea hybrida]
MDAVSATASIIAIIGAALNSLNAITRILGGIKDGPAHIQDLIVKMKDLESLLVQLQSLQQGTHGRGVGFNELAILTRRCWDDLHSFESELVKHHIGLGGGGWRALREGIRAMLGREKFHKMGQKMSDYYDVFTAQLC